MIADPADFQIPEKKIDESWKQSVEQERRRTQRDRGPVGPQANFETIISNLAMQAWIALGQVPNPTTGQRSVQPEQAKHLIDMLGVLKEKTKGNLSEGESALLDQYLYELRLGFLQHTKS